MEDVVSSRSHDGSEGRLPTGLRRGRALPVFGARGSPRRRPLGPRLPPQSPQPLPARPSRGSQTLDREGVGDIKAAAILGRRRSQPLRGQAARLRPSGRPWPSGGGCGGHASLRPDSHGSGRGGAGEGGGGGGIEVRGCGLRLMDRASDHPLEGGPGGRWAQPMGGPEPPGPPSPAPSEGVGGGACRAAPRRRGRSARLLTRAEAGSGRSGVAVVAQAGGGLGAERFVPRSRSQNRVRLVPAESPAQDRRQWGWPGAAQPPEAEAEAEAPGGGDG